MNPPSPTARCPRCSGTLSDSGFCYACAGRLAIGERLATPDTTASDAETVRPARARFVPGALVAARYRIVALAGTGGMGEVYRADDLRLGQTVALKFLPAGLVDDPVRRARLYAEVRLAREAAHPNVCRVYDVVEIDGDAFVTMEFVEGEDLASLLRRIGRLSRDKAAVVAREICAGLAAVHARGILHRDLKPQNVMLDARGHARLLDFGLATLADDPAGAALFAGTPAYMAPELLAGQPATVRSDLYALGMVLYELFTGRRPFEEGGSRRSQPPEPLSHLVRGLDPAVERAILRCLAPEASERPRSASVVMAAMPGDPLSAARAAGETPSPGTVAEATPEIELAPRAAAAALVVLFAALGLSVALAARTHLAALAPLASTPAVFAAQAEAILREAGAVPSRQAPSWGFVLEETGSVSERLVYWYRADVTREAPLASTRVWSQEDDPPPRPESARVRIDSRGRLRLLVVDPSSGASTLTTARLAEESGVDLARAEAVAPRVLPPSFADRREAWRVERPDGAVRIEAASAGGRIVFWSVEPDTGGARPEEAPVWARRIDAVGTVLRLAAMIAACLLARHNLKRGRGDSRGALRLAAAVFVARFTVWLVGGVHVSRFGGHGLLGSSGEASLLFGHLAESLFLAGFLWVAYLAAEPFVRRVWPERIIAWVRLLDGRVGDPLVGGELLVGAVAGALVACVLGAIRLTLETPERALEALDVPAGIEAIQLIALRGGRHGAGLVLEAALTAIFYGLLGILLVVLARAALRSTPAAAAVSGVAMTLAVLGPGLAAPQVPALAAAMIAILLATLLRTGVLAFLVAIFSWRLLAQGPLSLAPESASFATSLGTLSIVAALGIFGYLRVPKAVDSALSGTGRAGRDA